AVSSIPIDQFFDSPQIDQHGDNIPVADVAHGQFSGQRPGGGDLIIGDPVIERAKSLESTDIRRSVQRDTSLQTLVPATVDGGDAQWRIVEPRISNLKCHTGKQRVVDDAAYPRHYPSLAVGDIALIQDGLFRRPGPLTACNLLHQAHADALSSRFPPHTTLPFR